MSMNCALHKSFPLQYFCETCLDPICTQCVKSNPHSNQFHQICPIEQAVQVRKQEFDQYVDAQINPLRQQTRQKLQELKNIEAREVQKRNVIMKDIMLEFEAIDHRTKQKAEKHVLERQTQIKYYQSYLNALDDLAYTFDKTASDPYNLLILYQDFIQQLKSLELKEIKEKIETFDIDDGNVLLALGGQMSKVIQENSEKDKDQNTQQEVLRRLENELSLPREIKTTFQEVSTLESLRQRNELLNGIIAAACQNYKKQQKKVIADSVTKYKNKLHTFNIANQNIINLNTCKSCVFCGMPFTLDTANDLCNQNKSIKADLHEKYSHLTVAQELKGTKRHYWLDSSLASRIVPDVNAHQILRPTYKKAFKNSLNDLYVIKCCFRKYEIDNATVDSQTKTVSIKSFMTVFEEADKQKKGLLSKITFKYLLTKVFQMNSMHGDILTDLLSYQWLSLEEKVLNEEGKPLVDERKMPEKLQQIDGVNYRLLKDFMEDPLFPYDQWEKIQQENDRSKPIAPKSEDKGLYKYGAKR